MRITERCARTLPVCKRTGIGGCDAAASMAIRVGERVRLAIVG